MKLQHIIYASAMALVSGAAFTACTDDVKVGDSFVEKAPGGTVTIDTVFNSAEYTRQFLTGIYGMQYYGLPFSNASGLPTSQNHYWGKLDALTDCYQIHWNGTAIFNSYYSNTLSANDDPLISFNNDKVWAAVRQAYLLLENIDRVPGLAEADKKSYIAEAKCLIAARYFDLFSVYGGLPIIDKVFSGTEGDYSHLKRATVEETVNYMVNLLDEAAPDLRWAWDGDTKDTDAYNNTGRWTKAGALALKAKILVFAASPLFNANEGYYGGNSEAEKEHLVWYGNYDPARWTRAEQACREFFAANGEANPNSETLGTGGAFYELNQPTENSADAYRQAYRMGYIYQGSKEVIHSTRVATIYGTQGTYAWWNWVGIGRNSYCPTVEYVEMFPWANGEPFKWDDAASAPVAPSNAIKNNANQTVKLDGQLFFSPPQKSGKKTIQKYAIRDPRLYENAIVNGQPMTLDWNSGKSSGDIYELWTGGNNVGQSIAKTDGTIVEQLTFRYSTGFGTMKYYLGEEYHRKFMHWVYLSYDEMLLMWAEALAQTGDLTAALNCVNRVRARVGLDKMEKFDDELTTDKDKLIEEILRERACELGMSNNRYYDMIRYKRADWMCKELHGMKITRLQNVMGEWLPNYNPYIGTDKDNGLAEPDHFKYEKFTLQNRRRVMWDMDPNDLKVKKWFLFPLPITEINKGYGLVQNPGW
ncbi:RagB/SusD family nutrient uptake outer membrane protein [Xylanibacter brevis]|uniref:RagB/SusD family nutrient uptake outer membrane protein n=1 Tax=Xylanibacter brevis TaxID=83231 RepID=UPI0004809A3D|nr:RagB/SusD family nutrient uptake outer membrane protein [Xylanibacter brevis]